MIDLICGHIGRTASAAHDELIERMAASLAFGRPSSCRLFRDDGIALAEIAPAPGPGGTGASPRAAALAREGTFVATADLRLPDHPGWLPSRTLLLQAVRDGRFPEALDGDFAVAVWDGATRRLLLARDRVGIRPLFWARTPDGGVAFASFPDALIDAGIVSGRMEPAAMARIAIGDGPDGPRTWLEGVRRVPPGHVLSLGQGGERLRRYWSLPARPRERIADDHAVAAARLRRGLEQAVARTLPRAGRIATLLSGGLDSGAATALAVRLGGRPASEVLSFCVTMPERHRHTGAIDEEPTARAVAARLGVELRALPFDVAEATLARPLARSFVHPCPAEDPYSHALEQAAAAGAPALLCGYGGDEVVSFNGEGVLLADFLALRWRALARTAPELHEPLWRSLARQAAAELLPYPVESRLRRLLAGSPSHLPLMLNALRPAYRPRSGLALPTIGAARVQRRRITTGAFFHRLELQAWQAARHGIRYVYPLLDWRLLELGAALPARQHFRGGLRRALMRSAVADLLPAEIVVRSSKLNPVPTVLYQLAVDREAAIAEARRLAGSPAASAVADLGFIERVIASLPPADEIAGAIRAAAAEGRQFNDPRIGVLWVFVVARALAQAEQGAGSAGLAGSRAA